MAIESRGYDPRMGRSEQQLELFGENLELVLEHADRIVRCKTTSFARAGVPLGALGRGRVGWSIADAMLSA